jgi:hypothetical protein
LGAAALAVAGLLFLLYPAFRPWHDEDTVDGAPASMGSDAWVASHLFAMIGFILVPRTAPGSTCSSWPTRCGTGRWRSRRSGSGCCCRSSSRPRRDA